VADLDNGHGNDVIVNRTQDTVVSLSGTVLLVTGQFLLVGGSSAVILQAVEPLFTKDVYRESCHASVVAVADYGVGG